MKRDKRIAHPRHRIRSSKRSLAATLFTIALLSFATARADELSLIVNGKAIHFNEKPGIHYNESNWGAGFQFDFGGKSDPWVPFATGSGFIDSNSNSSYYAGGGIMRRYFLSEGNSRLHADLGMVAFAMIRKGFKNGDPFLGVLPAFSIGSDNVSVNVTFIPRVEPKAVPLLFFQLKISLNTFSK
jgi:hypothetical protein